MNIKQTEGALFAGFLECVVVKDFADGCVDAL